MANPPITIGSFDNVPAPGSPIKSDWPQEISNYVQALPRGQIGVASMSGDQTGIGATLTDITGLSVAFTADPTRRYKTSLEITCYPSVAASVVAAIANAAGALIRRGYVSVGAVNGYACITIFNVETGLSGAQTRKAQASTSAGTLVVYGSATTCQIVVEDLGKTLPT